VAQTKEMMMRTQWIGRTGLIFLLASVLLSVIAPRWFADAYWGTARAGMMNGTTGMMSGMMGGDGMMSGMMGGSTGTTATAPFDQRFLDEMILHHQGAVMMAQHMIADSPRAELRNLAQRIITAQQREVAQMQQWRQEWYGTANASSATMMNGMMGGMMNREQMRQMMGPGVDFDRMFLLMMVPHHEGAIAMAERALTEAEHGEIKTLAQTIITSQRAEIAEMQGYLRQWYGEGER
jgi:uncharacterized protein (DUF305 family)